MPVCLSAESETWPCISCVCLVAELCLYKYMQAGDEICLESRMRQDGCGFASAPYIGTSSRQVQARSVLPESVFGFAFGDYLDLDLAIFTLLFVTCFSPFPLVLFSFFLSIYPAANRHQPITYWATWPASSSLECV